MGLGLIFNLALFTDSFKVRSWYKFGLGKDWLSFESNRLKGLVSTLLLVLIPISFGIISGSLLLSGLSVTADIYLLIVNIVSNLLLLIVFVLAMNGFAKYYDDSQIFTNSFYAVIINSISIIIAPVILHVLEGLYLHPIFNLAISLVFLAVVGILTGFFYREAFYALAEKSGEQHFKHAGWLMFIGGILTVIAIGVFVIFLGRIFAVSGFFSMKPKSSQPSV